MKKYNPFKMWGSWVGAILGIFFASVISLEFFNKIFSPTTMLFNWLPDFISNARVSIIFMIVGFLIGWGIHSLFRHFKKGRK